MAKLTQCIKIQTVQIYLNEKSKSQIEKYDLNEILNFSLKFLCDFDIFSQKIQSSKKFIEHFFIFIHENGKGKIPFETLHLSDFVIQFTLF
jgi:hypothetical protein